MSEPLITEEMRTAALLASHSQPTRTVMVNAILAAVAPLIVERCAEVAHEHEEQAEATGLLHPENSGSRERMFARAREARAIRADIRALLEAPDA